MCVSRVGTGKDQNLARAYSADGGKSWSRVDRLPAYSVAPQIVRLANGGLTLVTGRPDSFCGFPVIHEARSGNSSTSWLIIIERFQVPFR